MLTGALLLEKLVPLIPPTYANLTRFHGVFAPTSRLRAKVVSPPPVEAPPTLCPSTGPAPVPSTQLAFSTPSPSPSPSPSPLPPRSAYRLDCAALLKRVFAGARRVPLWVDVMVCSRCDGPMKVMAFLEELTVVKGILTHLGLPAEPLPAVNAQAPPTAVEMFEDP